MSRRSERNGERHEVHSSQAIAAMIRRLQRQAITEGRGEQFLTSFHRILPLLRRDPMQVGDPLYYLPALRLHVRQVVVQPVLVEFGVSEDESLVFIKGVKLLPRKRF